MVPPLVGIDEATHKRRVPQVADDYKARGDYLKSDGHAALRSPLRPRAPAIPALQIVNKSRHCPSIRDVSPGTVNPCWQAMSPRAKFFRGNIEERCAAYAHEAAATRRPYMGLPIHHSFVEANPSSFKTSARRRPAVSPRTLANASLDNTVTTMTSLAATRSPRNFAAVSTVTASHAGASLSSLQTPSSTIRSSGSHTVGQHTPRSAAAFEPARTMTMPSGELVPAPESTDYVRLCERLPHFPNARSLYAAKKDMERATAEREAQQRFEAEHLTPRSAQDEIARFEMRRERILLQQQQQQQEQKSPPRSTAYAAAS